MQFPVFSLKASKYDKVSLHSEVLNDNQIAHELHLQIPVQIAHTCELHKLEELGDTVTEVSDESWKRDDNRIWYQIKTSYLNMSVGHHLYKLSFINRVTDDTMFLYFAYTIQSNNPEKPYIYVNRADKETQ